MAPEVLEQTEAGYDHKADIWSLGITALELSNGKPPYSECTAMKAIMKVMNEEPPALDTREGWDPSFIQFIDCCLQKDPKKR